MTEDVGNALCLFLLIYINLPTIEKLKTKKLKLKKKDFYVSKFKITCIRTNQQLVFTEKKKVKPVMILILYYPWHLDYTTTIQNIVESVISRLTVLHRNDKNTKKDNS